MLTLALIAVYLCIFGLVLGVAPSKKDIRPTLGSFEQGGTQDFRRSKTKYISLLKAISKINAPLCVGTLRKRLTKDIAISHVNISCEEFILIKEVIAIIFYVVTFPQVKPDMILAWICIGLVAGYMAPEYWLKGKIKKVKAVMVKELPDAIDLLGLCVNAGLDFMLSLKWVVEKSPPSVMMDELNVVLQEINVGKTRREAIKDLALRYELPDLSTFARTLIQADKMGTSVTEALNILSEDMRIARYRRGEQLALKSPMKMLVPLLLFIFPVVGILVAGPILLDFIENNPMESLSGKK